MREDHRLRNLSKGLMTLSGEDLWSQNTNWSQLTSGMNNQSIWIEIGRRVEEIKKD